ncbi:MAG: hypothetical protein KGL53_00490 [Elusimicrobia bacterium]|nr:hypothetical protein [Elusimicrobiota bacterium]
MTPRLSPLLLLPLLALAAGCRRVERAAPPLGRPLGVVRVVKGGQGQVGDLRIGLAYVRKGEPVLLGGSMRTLEAGLWVFVRGDEASDAKADLRAGQSVDAAKWRVFVEELEDGAGAHATVGVYERPPEDVPARP